MRITKKTGIVAGGLALALTLAACSGGNAPADSMELEVWHNSTTGPGQEFWVATAKAFEEEHEGVTVKVQSLQNEDLDGKLQTALNSGSAPDVFLQRGGGKLAAMAKAGQLKDITGKIADSVTAEIPAGSFSANELDGKLYTMPVAVLPGGIFYSQEVFDAAGITEIPNSIEELSAAVQKLKDADFEPIALGGKDAWPAAHWYYFFALRACSPETLATAADTMDFSNACFLKAGEDLKNFADTEPFNRGFLTTSAQQGAGSSAGLLANHKAGMELMGAWNAGVIAGLTPDQKPLEDLAWFPFPEVPGGEGLPGSILGGVDGYSCHVNAPDICIDFLNYLGSSDVQSAYYKAFNAPPVNTVSQKDVTEPYLQQIMEAYNAAPFVSQWLDTVYGSNVGNAMNAGVVDMLAGKGSPQGIIDAVKSAADKL